MLKLNPGSTTNRVGGSPAGGAYGEFGVGNNTASFREATRSGRFPSDNTGAGRSQGETPGAGSIYSAQLNERPNISNPRNRGPSRSPSRVGAKALPNVGMGSRATGRLG